MHRKKCVQRSGSGFLRTDNQKSWKLIASFVLGPNFYMTRIVARILKLNKQNNEFINFFFIDIFHPADINRVKTDDAYLRRFLMHHDGNLDGALNMLWDACEWRKKFGTNGKNLANYL